MAEREPFLSNTPKPSPKPPQDSNNLAPSWLPRPSSTATRFVAASGDAVIPIFTTTTTPTTSSSSPSFVDLVASINRSRILKHRSHSSPSVFTDARQPSVPAQMTRPPDSKSLTFIIRQASVGMILYAVAGIVLFLVKGGSFKGHRTHNLIDALYFSVVTLCTIGYGDIVPDTMFTKLATCIFILVGFGIIDILLNGLVSHVLDQQEAVLLSAVDKNHFNTMIKTYMVDSQKGRMRIRMKVALALAVVIICIAIGVIGIHYLESMRWVDSIYLSITSVTTVGYGDYTFKTANGRCFATVWLLVSTFAVAKAFLYLTELRIDKRNRIFAKLVLQKKMTLGDLVAADLDNDGSIRYS